MQNFKKPRNLLISLLFLIIIQIIYGAFVAGLNAGFVYNTYPKMGEKWIADSVTVMKPIWINFIDGIGGVQFVHRYLAIVVFSLIIYLLIISVKYTISSLQKTALIILVIAVSIQFMLGVITLLYAVPIALGVAHQIGAFILLGSVVFALFQFKKPTSL
jgi:heme a synthase